MPSVDEGLLQALSGRSLLRLIPEPHAARGNFAWFVRGQELRLFLSSAGFEAEARAEPASPWVRLSGSLEALPRSLTTLFAHLEAIAAVATAETLDQLHQPPAQPTYQREIRSVRDVLRGEITRADSDFTTLDEEAQALAIWSTLFGEGTLELEQAIRLAAQRLRAQGLLHYQALRQRGELYQTIEQRLLSARRGGELFDRPSRGQVRAIQSDVDELSADDWRDCLMNSLKEQHRVERSQALRLAFDYAREVYGLDAQRLRGGGRAERAIKSAINSAVRQGLLTRDGAMYLILAADFGEPLLRGMIERAEAPANEPQSALRLIEPGDSEFVQSPAAPRVAEPSAPREPTTSQALAAVSSEPASQPQRPVPASASLLEQLRQEVRLPGVNLQSNQVHPEFPNVALLSDIEPAALPIVAALPVVNVEPAVLPVVNVEPAALPVVNVEPEAPKSLLDQRLETLPFPVRTLNWARGFSVTTLGQLVAWDPESFADQRNVGKLTAAKTRATIEEALGCSWEQAWSAHTNKLPLDAPAPLQSDEEAVTARGALGWSAFGNTLTHELRDIPLLDLELPARMRNFTQEEGLVTLGQLFTFGYDELRARPNMGRKTLNDTLDALADELAERAHPARYSSFLELWREQLAGLKPMPRLILSRRAGMHGPAETLEDIGTMLGVSRERVRQIEAHVVERLQQKTRWKRDISRHLDEAFGGAKAVALDLLDAEPWWSGIANNERLFSFVLERLLGGNTHLFEAPSGARFVTKFAPDEFDDALENLQTRFNALAFPVPYSAILSLVEQECSKLDLALLDELEACVREQLLFQDEHIVLGVGSGRSDELVAFLGAQPSPVPIAIVEEKFGRRQMPEEVLYFKRGVVGVKKHFPDFEDWLAKLVPLCVQLMEQQAPGRQWLIPELHDELRESKAVPEWLGHWHLASLLRLSGKVEYLGRLRVALQGSAAERVQFEALFVQLLQDAGQPLSSEELLVRARKHTDVTEERGDMLFKEAPFVRLDKTTVGLLQRDIPGGPDAVAVAIAAVTEHLATTQRGLTPFQATQLVNKCSNTHAHWSRQLVQSILRNEATVRMDRSKNIGLAEWDDVRCPARAEFIRREVAKNGGSISVEVLSQQMAELYGNAPDRPALQGYVTQAGLSLKGDTITRPEAESTSLPPPSSVRLQLTGIPAELRELFNELTRHELLPAVTLEGRIAAHLDAFEREERVNEFVDADGARALAAQCRALLVRWEALPLADRHLAQAAILYFVIIQDRANDFDISGLDDDKRVMSAVLEAIGLNELAGSVNAVAN